VIYSGACFLFGGYAYQVEKAEAARRQNERVLDELQNAHRRLQGYAAQVEELAAEQERSRLARELHDSVTQTVFSMNLAVQSASLLLEREPARVAGQLLQVETLASSALGEIQALVTQLRPQPATAAGLPAALHRLAASLQERSGLQVSVEVQGEALALAPAVAENLYAIAQEALANVCKHAGVSQATIRLDLNAGQGCLEIIDQGQGFDPQSVAPAHGHLGLTAMSERARQVGWSLSVQSQPGQGVCIRVCERPAGDQSPSGARL